MKNISVIIPAYKPDEKLIDTIQSIVEIGFSDIIVVDDGGGSDYDGIFDKVLSIPECTLLRHEVNKGKGVALKTAMQYFVENRNDQMGAITVDADGQHLAKDIKAVCECMAEKGTIVFGCRDFSGKNVPARSRFGNKMTIGIVRLFFGLKLSDTQTGLRAFPHEIIPDMLKVKGERYEYETQMLYYMSKHSIPFNEVKIETVYLEDNSSSHFRPIRDSIRIYSLIIKYLLSSLGSTALDAGVFLALKHFDFLDLPFLPETFGASFIARAVSSAVNYLINANAVFGDDVNKKTLAKYCALVITQVCVSAAAVFIIETVLSIDNAVISTIIKLIVDAVLFFFSFRIQHKWVFGRKDK